MLTIEEVTTSKDLKRFIRFPYRLYRAFPMWVPPLMAQMKDTLNPKKNPFFGHAAVKHFLARKNGRTAGRITAIVDDNYIRFQQEKAGFFGYYETIYDKEVSQRLLSAAETFLRNQGMEIMRGPINLSTNNECGLLVEGYELPPVIMMPYNPPYYQELLDHYGLHKAMDLYAYLMREQDVGERIRRYMEIIHLPEGYTIRPINIKRLHQEIQKVKTIYNQAWEKNWGFVPMEDAEIDHLAKELKMIIHPDILLMVEKDGEAIGFALSLPDINYALSKINGRLLPFGLFKLLYYKNKTKTIRTIIMGVLKEHRRKAIAPMLYMKTIENGLRVGFTQSECSWILENNRAMNRDLVRLGAKRYKTYRIYEKTL